jgi:hypothetical protein
LLASVDDDVREADKAVLSILDEEELDELIALLDKVRAGKRARTKARAEA